MHTNYPLNETQILENLDQITKTISSLECENNLIQIKNIFICIINIIYSKYYINDNIINSNDPLYGSYKKYEKIDEDHNKLINICYEAYNCMLYNLTINNSNNNFISIDDINVITNNFEILFNRNNKMIPVVNNKKKIIEFQEMQKRLEKDISQLEYDSKIKKQQLENIKKYIILMQK